MNKTENKKIAETTLFLLKNKRWENLTLEEIKKKSKIRSFEKKIKNKQQVLKEINKFFDNSR